MRQVRQGDMVRLVHGDGPEEMLPEGLEDLEGRVFRVSQVRLRDGRYDPYVILEPPTPHSRVVGWLFGNPNWELVEEDSFVSLWYNN